MSLFEALRDRARVDELPRTAAEKVDRTAVGRRLSETA